MADSSVEIIFQYNGGFDQYSKQSARMRFQHSIHGKFNVQKEVGFFGVRLFPNAVTQLLGMPATELVNQVADFSTLFKQDGDDTADQIFGAMNSFERIDVIEDFLTKKRKLNKKIDPINYLVDQVILMGGQVDISGLYRQSGLSIKQFERRFKNITGFPPKFFARIVRFQATKLKYGSIGAQTLTELAYNCNYYDQSHFIREFKEFSGVQPLKYFKILENQNPDFQEDTPAFSNTIAHYKYDGYHLPCGWFV